MMVDPVHGSLLLRGTQANSAEAMLFNSWQEALAEIDRLRADRANMAARAEAIIASENRLRNENAELANFVNKIANAPEMSGRAMLHFIKKARAVLVKTAKEGE